MTLKTRIIFGLLLLLSMGSCQFATFDARPGIIVKTYPKEIYGTWQSIEELKEGKDTHTLEISEKGVKIDASAEKLMNLSDTNNSLSHLGDFYYLNVREEDSTGNPYYIVYPFEFDDNHIYVYSLSLGKTEKKLRKRLQPASARTGHFKMDDEAFKTYCERNLKKRKAMTLTRIK